MSSPHELLAAVPLFSDLDADTLDEIAASTHLKKFPVGENIFEIGEPGRSLFIVTEGTVEIRSPNRESHFELATFGPGDFFGEMALLNDAPRSATVSTLSPVEALVLDKVDFRRILGEKPYVALKILEKMSVRIRTADEQISRLTDRAIRDPLTGLLNKRAFTDRLDQEISRARRYGGSFSLIILDFDGFDAVNQRAGREKGDRVLSWVGRLLSEHTRGPDVPFRFEDDTFTILCPWTADEYAATVAARLSALVNEAKPPVDLDMQLSISTGTATCPSDAQEALALYKVAYAELRAQKG